MTVTATGTAQAGLNSLAALNSFDNFITGTAAIFEEEAQITSAVSVISGGDLKFEIDTGELATGEHTLTFAYYGDDNMCEQSSAFTVTVKERDFTVTSGTEGTDYIYSGCVLTVLNDCTIAMADGVDTADDTIKVTSDDAVTVTLNGVNIESTDISPLEIDAEGNVTISLSGDNTLSADAGDSNSGYGYAGLQKTSEENTLVITGDGSLTAFGSGSIDYDTYEYYGGAGIGGGEYGSGENIIISGGYITATGGRYAAGIGGGEDGSTASNISITGGHYPDGSCTVGGYGTGVVYGYDIAEDYKVYSSAEEATKEAYPYQVSAADITLTYAKPDGAEGEQPSDVSCEYGETLTVSTSLPYTKDGYKQTGWSTSKTDGMVGTSPAVSSFTILDSTTLYPVFTRTFTDSGNETSITLTYGTEITEIDLTDYLAFVDTELEEDGQFTFALAANNELPAGLTLENGVISGKPTAVNESGASVSFTVTDKTPYITLAGLDSTSATVSATLSLRLRSIRQRRHIPRRRQKTIWFIPAMRKILSRREQLKTVRCITA